MTLPTGSDPYGVYRFVTAGFATDLTVDHDCPYPRYMSTNVCSYALVISVTNTGGTPLQSEPWEVTDPDGIVVASGSHDWAAAPTLEITLTGLDPYRVYTFTTTGFTDDYDAITLCGAKVRRWKSNIPAPRRRASPSPITAVIC